MFYPKYDIGTILLKLRFKGIMNIWQHWFWSICEYNRDNKKIGKNWHGFIDSHSKKKKLFNIIKSKNFFPKILQYDFALFCSQPWSYVNVEIRDVSKKNK